MASNRELLRQKGQFWTPEWVADAMVRYVTLNRPKRLLDPAAGTGIFYSVLKNIGPIEYYGLDIDPNVFGLGKELGIYDDACKLELRDYILATPEEYFPAIVANPPYIRHHRLSAEMKKRCQEIATTNGLKIDGRAGLHVFFLIQSIAMLEDNGRLAYIVPADICEGVFAKNLWQWVFERCSLDYLVTFDPAITPFPNVDVNAVVVMLRKTPSKQDVHCVRCHEQSNDLAQFVTGLLPTNTISIERRTQTDLLQTGLTRPRMKTASKHCLGDFAKTMRGIVTGCNEFFFLTGQQVEQFQLPSKYLQRAVGRTRDVPGERLTVETIDALDKKGRPTYLVTIQNEELDETTKQYLAMGVSQKLPERPLIRTRKPWYKMETRTPPPILFAYLGRRNVRFIWNDIKVVPLTSFICVYPHSDDQSYHYRLWQALNHPLTLDNLPCVGKSYGSGAIKIEPRQLEKLPMPLSVVEHFSLVF